MKTPIATATEAALRTPRETRYAGDDGIAVVMPVGKAPGVHAFGDLKPGVEYVVKPDEARRLVHVKQFEFASDEDRRRAEATAQPDEPPAAAAATSED